MALRTSQRWRRPSLLENVPPPPPTPVLLQLLAGTLIFLTVVFSPWIAALLVLLGKLRPAFAGVFFALYYGNAVYGEIHRRSLGSPWPWFVEHFPPLRAWRGYFKMRLHVPPALQPDAVSEDDKYVFACHPHGSASEFRLLMDGLMRESFPKLKSWRALAATICFFTPGLREITLWSHGVDAGRDTAHAAMRAGHSIFVVPGGEFEQMLTIRGREIVYLNKRKGFVRLALKHGFRIVPIYVFGCSDLYDTSDWALDWRMALMKNYHVALPLYSGPHGLPGVPYQVPLEVVFGAPLGPFPKTTDEDVVDRVHAEYIEALRALFDEKKHEFGYGDRELEVV